MFLHGRGKSQTILLRKSNFQWFLFLIVICSAFVCQDFRTHINVRYLFQLFDCQLFCIFCCILMKVRRPISWLRNINSDFFATPQKRQNIFQLLFENPGTLFLARFTPAACRNCRKQLQPSTTIRKMGDS